MPERVGEITYLLVDMTLPFSKRLAVDRCPVETNISSRVCTALFFTLVVGVFFALPDFAQHLLFEPQSQIDELLFNNIF